MMTLAATAAILLTSLFPVDAGEAHSRWSIKTSLPERLGEVRTVELEVLRVLPLVPGVRMRDARYDATRIAEVVPPGLREGDLIRTAGTLWLAAAEADGDYHLQISTAGDKTRCLVVEVPDPKLVSGDERVRAAVAVVRVTVRSWLGGRAPAAGGTLLPPVRVEILGQLFYDDAHVGAPPRGKRGCRSGTLWELHPVLDMKEVK